MHARRWCAAAAVWFVVALPLAAQDSSMPATDTGRRDTITLRPPEPTADQQRYLRGLRTVARGVAQLRSGVDRVGRAEGGGDTARVRQAGQLLAGLCGTARNFMTQGRATMQPTVYEDSARVKARRLVLQIDSLIKAAPACESGAVQAPGRAANDLLGRLRSYETALQEFRAAVTAPVPVSPPSPPS